MLMQFKQTFKCESIYLNEFIKKFQNLFSHQRYRLKKLTRAS